jgi:hypothetical protein
MWLDIDASSIASKRHINIISPKYFKQKKEKKFTEGV